jgi:hypothetical protein
MPTKGVTLVAEIALLFVFLTRYRQGDRMEEDETSETCDIGKMRKVKRTLIGKPENMRPF